MSKRDKSYIYINMHPNDGGVFVSQVTGWLNLYAVNNITFTLLQAYSFSGFRSRHYFSYLKNQKESIRKEYRYQTRFVLVFPSGILFSFINEIILIAGLFKYLVCSKEIVILSRFSFSKEIKWLKTLFPYKIKYIYDARAAVVEEYKYVAKLNQNVKAKIVKRLYRQECEISSIADVVFSVSNNLSSYINKTYSVDLNRFVLFPCLSNSSFFYYDKHLRVKVREAYSISPNDTVFIYSGGIKQPWHLPDRIFAFFNEISSSVPNSKFIILAKRDDGVSSLLSQYHNLEKKLLCLSVENAEVNNYLNAADYGFLLREDTPMNNVASPTKFAEYMLSGLFTFISNGVGDYSQFCKDNPSCGYLLSSNELFAPSLINFQSIVTNKPNREEIANIGKRFFDKKSILPTIINTFKTI